MIDKFTKLTESKEGIITGLILFGVIFAAYLIYKIWKDKRNNNPKLESGKKLLNEV